MPLYQCPVCGYPLEVTQEHCGGTVTCPFCCRQLQVTLRVPFSPKPPPVPPPYCAQRVERPSVAPSATGAPPVIAEVVRELPSHGQRSYVRAAGVRHPTEHLVLTATLVVCAVAIMLFSLPTVGLSLLIAGATFWGIWASERGCLRFLPPVTSASHPVLHHLAQIAASRLSMPVPPIYIRDAPTINAFAAGFFMPPIVVLHSATVYQLPPEYLLFILGHEMAHVKCGHVAWLTLTNAGGLAITNSLAALVFQVAFHWWSRLGEFTADRGGLLACRNVDHAVGALTALEVTAGGRIERLRQQVTVPAADDSDLISTHPTNAKRIIGSRGTGGFFRLCNPRSPDARWEFFPPASRRSLC